MKLRFGLPDTIAWRIALTVGAAILSVLALSVLFDHVAGPSSAERAELDRADDAIRMIEAAPPQDRQHLADTVTIADRVIWYPSSVALAHMFATARLREPGLGKTERFRGTERVRESVIFTSADSLAASIDFDRIAHPSAYFMAVQLRDHSWVLFIANHRRLGNSCPRGWRRCWCPSQR
jgi:hypothetical protein